VVPRFDSWTICDTGCFHLFDRTPDAWPKVEQWSRRHDEFVKRAGFALLASLVAHDKRAADQRNFVRKAVNWALRCIGKRNLTLNAAAVAAARRLSASPHDATRWVGKHALRELTSPAVVRRLAARG
jgi:3-methyladenine DNA glycosylase AlkD